MSFSFVLAIRPYNIQKFSLHLVLVPRISLYIIEKEQNRDDCCKRIMNVMTWLVDKKEMTASQVTWGVSFICS